MSRNLVAPRFPSPPREYDPRYFADLVRAFATYQQQVQNPGELFATSLTLNSSGEKSPAGKLSYNAAEDTVNLTHLNGITQQIGFETYMRASNDTGATIPNGSAVGFSGVNGEIKIAPYIADGTMPELYFIGITTFEMVDGATGPVTVYGKVRGLDTTGTPVGETWAKGDILYASPTNVGKLTKVRPTAPDAVIVVAAVLSVSATDGEIMVRPTIPLGLDYGSFSDKTTQTLAAVNTATPIKLNTTEISNGVTIVNDGSGNPTRITVSEAGFYQIAVSNQYTSSNASAQNVQTWLSKNGTNVPDSNSYVTLTGNGVNSIFATTYTISLQASDYVQVMWASNSTDVYINNIAATSYSPAAPSVLVSVTQIQL